MEDCLKEKRMKAVKGSDQVTVFDLTRGRENVRLTYATFPAWVKGRAPSFHAGGVSAKAQASEGRGQRRGYGRTYTNGSLTDTTKTLPALLRLGLLM